jgi:hypothetical protein
MTGRCLGFQRVDVRVFAWKYTSKKLVDIAKDMLAVAFIISSVDLKQVPPFSIRSLVTGAVREYTS